MDRAARLREQIARLDRMDRMAADLLARLAGDVGSRKLIRSMTRERERSRALRARLAYDLAGLEAAPAPPRPAPAGAPPGTTLH